MTGGETRGKHSVKGVRTSLSETWLMAEAAQGNLSKIGVPERFLNLFRPPAMQSFAVIFSSQKRHPQLR
jgi:hypothetical protein